MNTLEASARAATSSGRWRLFTALAALGAVGVLAGMPLNGAIVSDAAPQGATGATVVVAGIALLVQAALCAWVFVTLGRRVGLDAPMLRAAAERRAWWAGLRRTMPLAVGLGALAFAAAAVLDLVAFESVRARLEAPSIPVGAHFLASLYGGIFEELLVRGGLMTVLAWLLVVATRQQPGSAPTWIVWSSIVAAALVFGVLHLPATAVMIGLEPVTVARALLLNVPFGLAFGWLTWRRGLEVAMVSHLVADLLLIGTQHLT